MDEEKELIHTIGNLIEEFTDEKPVEDDDIELMHYGTPRHSGRYPWGSGENPYQRTGDFISRVEKLKAQGIKNDEIAKQLIGPHAKAGDLSVQISLAKNTRRDILANRVLQLHEKGLSLNQIKDKLNSEFDGQYGYKHKDNDSSIRSLLNQAISENKRKPEKVAGYLEEQLKTKPMLDVGAGVELQLTKALGTKVTDSTVNKALGILKNEGYEVYNRRMDYTTDPNGMRKITLQVLAPEGTPYRDIYQKLGDIKPVIDLQTTVTKQSERKPAEYPSSISSDRVAIKYGDEGGTAKDGVIEIRRGCKDLDLGKSSYAQVRIMVDGTHYLKGMAIYSDNVPEGKDILFNTNKLSDTPKMKVLKPIKSDPDNPFGALIKENGQSYYTDTDGKKKLSAINKLKEENDWDAMAKTVSSQFLSKQPIPLIKRQLDLTYKDNVATYKEIMELTNPVVKKKMLEDFADLCESSAVSLKAVSFPRQRTQVILPLTGIKDNEVYAPNYTNGEYVCLVRYPHAGTFEIPKLKVNNLNPDGKKFIGPNAKDAIGISTAVAERLSGADFDGDTVTVIPTNERVKIKSTPPLKGLEGFDPKRTYATTSKDVVKNDGTVEERFYNSDGKRINPMSKTMTQKEMGAISNLITDMTLRGADDKEMARAVRHSMTVIDAEKHHLDYRNSEKDNDIESLRRKYQKHTDDDGYGGASTLLSKRKQEVNVPERQGERRINDDGSVWYKETGRYYVDVPKDTPNRKDVFKRISEMEKQGMSKQEIGDKLGYKVKQATSKDKLITMTPDVMSLSSGTMQENLYAQYANNMKSLANEARKSYKLIETRKLDSQTKKVVKAEYSKEIESLNAKLNNALLNAPRERQAHVLANSRIEAKLADNPSLKDDKKELSKQRSIALEKARRDTGASGRDNQIVLTDREWECIQAGGITDSKASSIFKYVDSDRLKELATPHTYNTISPAMQSRIKNLSAGGYTNKEIADALGISVSSVVKYNE